MKKNFIKQTSAEDGTVTIEEMLLCAIKMDKDDTIIIGTGGPAETDFEVYCNRKQLHQLLIEADRHPQGLKKVAKEIRSGKCETVIFDEPLFVNNVLLHATFLAKENGTTAYWLNSLTVVNSSDNDRIWAANTAQICNEFLCSYFLANRRGKAEPISDNLIARIAYLEFRKTFPSVASAG